VCQGEPSRALMANCRRQARFLEQFPECDSACHARLSPYLGYGVR
jgi:hypothetical protein